MNCRGENYNAFIAMKMSGWKEVANCGIDKFEQTRGRRNLRALADAHPEIAAECGLGQSANGMGGSTMFETRG